ARNVRIGWDQVGLLAAVRAEVVQLRLRSGNVFPRFRADRTERRPAELDQRRERLGVQLAGGETTARERRSQVEPVGVLRLDSQQTRGRGRDIRQGDRLAHDVAL